MTEREVKETEMMSTFWGGEVEVGDFMSDRDWRIAWSWSVWMITVFCGDRVGFGH